MGPRRQKLKCVGILAIACGLATPAAPLRAEAPAIKGVLVLRNGNVLAGAVRRYGDDYRIDVADATMRVPADQVERFAATLQEAYEARRASRVGASPDSHLELAQWCLRLNLLDEAAREMLDARTLDPGHPELAGLQLRLRESLELEAARQEPVHPASSAEAPAEKAAEPPVEISTAAQIKFVRSIQPMLVRSCALGGCHQPGAGQQLQLDRWALEGNGNAELVRRNLTAVLREVNAEDPPSSSLIHWARLTHGHHAGVASRPLAAHQSAILLEWLNHAAGIEPTPDADAAFTEGEALAVANGEVVVGAPSPASSQIEGFAPALSPAPRARSRRLAPRDAFDAEIFNRRTPRRTAKDADDEGAADAAPTENEALDEGAIEVDQSSVSRAKPTDEVTAPAE